MLLLLKFVLFPVCYTHKSKRFKTCNVKFLLIQTYSCLGNVKKRTHRSKRKKNDDDDEGKCRNFR